MDLPLPPPLYDLYEPTTDRAIMIVPWSEAPDSVRALSPCGGDEELVAYVPSALVEGWERGTPTPVAWVESWLRNPPYDWEPTEVWLAGGSLLVFFRH